MKEMLKSVQTMVRVRESEVERYKHKTEQYEIKSNSSKKFDEVVSERPKVLPKLNHHK